MLMQTYIKAYYMEESALLSSALDFTSGEVRRDARFWRYVLKGWRLAKKFWDLNTDGQLPQQRAARELYTWSRLKHSNILELLGLAQFRGHLAMISPWMDNGTLREYLERNPQVDRYQLTCLLTILYHQMCGITDGLAYLHQNETVKNILGCQLCRFI
ncbi:hypothetical protein FRC07_010446 [Ceratobasidium sp. 392]|nr:hypothetical protein FRC07_010446 [Ceratobasidium sp. 392]